VESRRSRSARILAAAGVALGLLGVAHGQAATRHRLYVAVMDDNRRPVTGIAPDAFHVWENQTARTLVGAVPASDPLSIVIIVTGVPRNDDILSVRRTLSALLDQLRAADSETRVALTTAVQTPRLAGISRGAADLDTAIKYFAGTGPGLLLFEAIDDACKALRAEATDRRAVLVFANVAMRDSVTVSAQRMLAVLKEAGVSLWAIDFSSNPLRLPGMDSERRNRETDYVLSVGTSVSGGAYDTSVGLTALPGVATGLARLLLAQYAVTYERPVGEAPGEVRVGVRGAVGERVLATGWPPK